MKWQKQTAAKTLIVAAATGAFFFFFGLIRAEPRIKAEEATPEPAPPIDYQRFFAPSGNIPQAAPTPLPATRPHTRTRAS